MDFASDGASVRSADVYDRFGDEDSRNAALETLSGVRAIKENLPGALTLLGCRT